MSQADLNPQPLPPRVDLAELTEAVTVSIRRALEEREVGGRTPALFRNPRIVIGVIIEPQTLAE